MAINIPGDYNYKTEEFDPLEMIVRDKLSIDIENWAKFRHTITASVSSISLVSQSNQPISDNVKQAYIELSKSHYEVVTMLGATKMSLINVIEVVHKDPLAFKKSLKEFYMHAGSILDNLARLIYIVNISNGVSDVDRFGKLVRHSIGYGNLKKIYNDNKTQMVGYARISDSKVINEIKNIRNNFTHSWPPVMFISSGTNEYLWPKAMRKRSQYYLWPHDQEEKQKMKSQLRSKIPVLKMLEQDWIAIEAFQSSVFKKLYQDVRKFERNHNLVIV